MRLKESGTSPRVYLVDPGTEANRPAPAGWFAFLLPAGVSGPPWGVLQPAATLGMAGFYVTCPRPPASLTAFVAEASAVLDAFVRKHGVGNRSASWFTWFADPDATGAAMGLQVLSVRQQGSVFLTDTVSPNVTVRDVSLSIGAGAGVTYDEHQGAFAIFAGAGLSLTVGGGNSVGAVDQHLSVPISGSAQGCVQAACTVTRWREFSVISPSISYYTPATEAGRLRHWRFPLFDGSAIGDSGVSLGLLLDPSTPEDPDRTGFAFRDSPALPSFLRTTTGETVVLTPEGAATRIGFANRPAAVSGGVAQPSTLTPYPDGPFEVGLAPSRSGLPASGSAFLLPGLAGTEYLDTPLDGAVLEFTGGRPALVPFPLAPGVTAAPGSGALLTDGGGGATTAWARLSAAGSGLAYHVQPQSAPLFAAPTAPTGDGDVVVLGPQPTALWTGARAPLVPLTPYAGASTTDAADIALLEQRAVALTRQRAMTGAVRALPAAAPRPLPPAGLGAPPARVWSTDHRGFRVGLEDGRWAAVTFASTPAQTGAPAIDLTLEIAQPVVAEALQGDLVFLVATTTVGADGAPLFTLDGSLYLGGWQAAPRLASTWDRTAPVGTTTPMMIVKLGDKKLSDVALDLDAWTDKDTFLPRPAATQAALAAIIAAARSAVGGARGASGPPGAERPTDGATLFEHFLHVVDDPSWNGVLFLGAHLGEAPPVIRGVLSGVPPDDLRWHHAGVWFSQVETDASLRLAGSDTFGLVDYTTDATPSLSGSDYLFWTRWLQALFTGSSLSSFNCRVALGLPMFFGVPLAPAGGTAAAGGGSGTTPVLEIDGVYQERSGGSGTTGVYSFITTEQHAFTFDYSAATSLVTAQILRSMTLTKIQLGPGGATADEITSDFLFWGSLGFGRIVGGATAAGLDVFNYDTLPFGSVVLAMSAPAAGGPPNRWSLGTADATFDLATATLRPGGLVGSLPLELRSMRYADGAAFGLTDLGYTPLGLPPGNPDQAGAVSAALLYTIDLGRPGTLGSGEPILASVLCGWNPDGGVLLGLSVPGLGSDSTLRFEGVMKLLLGSFRLNEVTPPPAGPVGAATKLVTLEVDSCTFELLGAQFPQSPLSLTLVVADPAATGTVLWYAAWPPPDPPGDRAPAVRVGGLAPQPLARPTRRG